MPKSALELQRRKSLRIAARQRFTSVANTASQLAASSLFVLAVWSARSAALLSRNVSSNGRYKVKKGRIRFGGKWISLNQFQQIQVAFLFFFYFNLFLSSSSFVLLLRFVCACVRFFVGFLRRAIRANSKSTWLNVEVSVFLLFPWRNRAFDFTVLGSIKKKRCHSSLKGLITSHAWRYFADRAR